MPISPLSTTGKRKRSQDSQALQDLKNSTSLEGASDLQRQQFGHFLQDLFMILKE